MKILFVSKDLAGVNLTQLLQKEGHEVKLYIKDKSMLRSFDGFVEKSRNWEKEIPWVGKDGLIIFDDSGYGYEQDELRKEGYRVFGGGEGADSLEYKREYAQAIFKNHGMQVVDIHDFNSPEDALEFAKLNPKPWVIKRNSKNTKLINYVSRFDDGRDIINLLEKYTSSFKIRKQKVTLQERVDGIEIGVGRYFNGLDWVGPIEINIEHTHLFPGDLGPLTAELGTLAWFTDNEEQPLYKETIYRLTEYLRTINFRGDFEINTIVNENGVFPLEATPRIGSPIVHLHTELKTSPWGEFLYAIASGEKYDLKWKEGYGIVVSLAVPPFPYDTDTTHEIYDGIRIHFDGLSESDIENHVHFEETRKEIGEDGVKHIISGGEGYLLYVTEIGKTVEEAQEKVYNIASKIVIPKVFYRNDIGDSFKNKNEKKLKEWGWI